MAEDGWNSRSPEKVAAAYTPDCHWRNRAEIFQGRDRIVEFLTQKWARELDYRLITENQRLLRWASPVRPDDHPGLARLDL
jgi:nuclear transport factor 2 (NTF2) superfamily protein